MATDATGQGEVRVTYDGQANAAYIYLTGDERPKPARMYPCDPVDVRGMINLDFDDDDRLIGIEVLDARSRLPQRLINSAERLDVEGT